MTQYSITATAMKKPQTHFALVVFVSWLCGAAFAFWWFQFQYVNAFDNQLATFNGEQLKQLHLLPGGNKSALVVHFVDPDCPCNQFSRPHIEDLEAKLATTTEFSVRRIQAIDSRQLRLPATPAVAIWSESGELAYFGPYSSGAICGSGDDLVVKVVNDLHRGINPQWINLDAVGCFCPLRDTPETSAT